MASAARGGSGEAGRRERARSLRDTGRVTLDRVFVYGTLKRGLANHHLVAPFVVEAIAPAALPGFTLFDSGPREPTGQGLPRGPFPGARPAPGARVVGELLVVREPRAALRVLDVLEEHPTFYRRRRRLVDVGGRRVRAWLYELVEDQGWAWTPCGERWP